MNNKKALKTITYAVILYAALIMFVFFVILHFLSIRTPYEEFCYKQNSTMISFVSPNINHNITEYKVQCGDDYWTNCTMTTHCERYTPWGDCTKNVSVLNCTNKSRNRR